MTVDEEMIRRLQATLLAKIRGGDPCMMCVGGILWSGIGRVIYAPRGIMQ